MLKLVEKEELEVAGTFEEFWAIYPNKKAKKDALKVWGRIPMTPELWERIEQSIKAHKRTEAWTDGGGKFIPHPATWLNGERWDDEVEADISVTPCQWPKCKGMGTRKYGSKDFCESHVQALKRGETP